MLVLPCFCQRWYQQQRQRNAGRSKRMISLAADTHLINRFADDYAWHNLSKAALKNVLLREHSEKFGRGDLP